MARQHPPMTERIRFDTRDMLTIETHTERPYLILKQRDAVVVRLTRAQVAALLPRLQAWVETGDVHAL